MLGNLVKSEIKDDMIEYIKHDWNIEKISKPIVVFDSIIEWSLSSLKVDADVKLAFAIYRGKKIRYMDYFLSYLPNVVKRFINKPSTREMWSQIYIMNGPGTLIETEPEPEEYSSSTDKEVLYIDKKPFQPICPALYDGILDIVNRKEYLENIEKSLERKWELEQLKNDCLVCMESKTNVFNKCGHGLCEHCFKRMKIFAMLENKEIKCPQCKEEMTEKTSVKIVSEDMECTNDYKYLECIKTIKEKHPKSELVFLVKNFEQMFKIYEYILNEWPNSTVSRKKYFKDVNGTFRDIFHFVFEKSDFPDCEHTGQEFVGIDFTFSRIESEFCMLKKLYRFGF
jgi:hypothetical protein